MSFDNIFYYLVWVFVVGNGLNTKNSYHPRLFWANTWQLNTVLSEPYWLNDLKESLFNAIVLEQDGDEETYYSIFTAPYCSGPSRPTQFGDIALLAAGELKENANQGFIFCQSECQECYVCHDITSQPLFRWTVTRIRHRNSGQRYHYDVLFNIKPTRIRVNPCFSRTDIQKKNLMHTIANSKIPITRMPSAREYGISTRHSTPYYDNEMERYMKKFKVLYKPGFITKTGLNGVKLVKYNLSHISRIKADRSAVTNRIGARHHTELPQFNSNISMTRENANHNNTQSPGYVEREVNNIGNYQLNPDGTALKLAIHNITNQTHISTVVLSSNVNSTQILAHRTVVKSSNMPNNSATLDEKITRDTMNKKNIQLETKQSETFTI